jgi:hypothetical protein
LRAFGKEIRLVELLFGTSIVGVECRLLCFLKAWYFIVATHHGIGGVMSLYVNGVKKTTGVHSQPAVTDAKNLIVGNWNPLAKAFNGAIDSLLLLNDSLTDDDVTFLYEKSRYYSLSYAALFGDTPTSQPSQTPTQQPSSVPSRQPISNPTALPSSQPFGVPSSLPSQQPSSKPTCRPSLHPSCQPSSCPTSQPSIRPSLQPTSRPSDKPSCQPSIQPSSKPSSQPSDQPTFYPSTQPTVVPSKQPSSHPTTSPSRCPSPQPSSFPTGQPSNLPSNQPSGHPSAYPSCQPSSIPTNQPSRLPSTSPTCQPSSIPTNQPSRLPSVSPTCQPSSKPTNQPSLKPTNQPSLKPTNQPSMSPSCQPSVQPTKQPSVQPSSIPSTIPSCRPSVQPSSRPSAQPILRPSSQPTLIPSCFPSTQPSVKPTSQPTRVPSCFPSSQPSVKPTSQPTRVPSCFPSTQPSVRPSLQPSSRPSRVPSVQPSSLPSFQPTSVPSVQPSTLPSGKPSGNPTMVPSTQPISRPSSQPSIIPSLQPYSHPSGQPSSLPSICPSSVPSVQPSLKPSHYPSSSPTIFPTSQPSDQPLSLPSSVPTEIPTLPPQSCPSYNPTSVPSLHPSSIPTRQPSSSPSAVPISYPSAEPSICPSVQPSSRPTDHPSNCPSTLPTLQPSSSPSTPPSAPPSRQPSSSPSRLPTTQPSTRPSFKPFVFPTFRPISNLSSKPSVQPTLNPSLLPSTTPSSHPSFQPSVSPTASQFGQPTLSPSHNADTVPIVSRSPTFLSPTSKPIPVISLFSSSVIPPFKQTNFLLGSDKNGKALRNIVIPSLSANILGKSFLILGSANFPDVIDLSQVEVKMAGKFQCVSLTDRGVYLDGVGTRTVVIGGDFNGDYRSDLLIGEPSVSKVYVFFSSLATIPFRNVSEGFHFDGGPLFSGLGWAICSAGDFDGDGKEDLLISAIYSNKCVVLFGKNPTSSLLSEISLDSYLNDEENGIILTMRSDPVLSTFGIAVANAWDIDGDGLNDIAVSALGVNGANKIFIILGRSKENSPVSLIVNHPSQSQGVITISAPAYSFAGISLDGIKDFNGDGLGDLLIGSTPYSKGYSTQISYLVYGKRGFDRSTSLANVTKEGRGSIIIGGGIVVNGLEDVNGDGYDDMMITNYMDWQGNSRSFLAVLPSKRDWVSNIPTVLPSSSPSFEQTPLPSFDPTSLPSSSETSVPTKFIFNLTSSPSFTATVAPTKFPTILPSLIPTKWPTRLPSITPSVSPSTRLPSRRPSLSPSKSSSPIAFPTSVPSLSVSSQKVTVQISSGSEYTGSKGNSTFLIDTATNIIIHGNLGKKIFIISPSMVNVTITITDFDVVKGDVLDLSLLSLYADFTYFMNPLRFEIGEPFNIQIILASHSDYDLEEKNLVFPSSTYTISSSDMSNPPLSSQIFKVISTTEFIASICMFFGVFSVAFYFSRRKSALKNNHKGDKKIQMDNKPHQHLEHSNIELSSDSAIGEDENSFSYALTLSDLFSSHLSGGSEASFENYQEEKSSEICSELLEAGFGECDSLSDDIYGSGYLRVGFPLNSADMESSHLDEQANEVVDDDV